MEEYNTAMEIYRQVQPYLTRGLLTAMTGIIGYLGYHTYRTWGEEKEKARVSNAERDELEDRFGDKSDDELVEELRRRYSDLWSKFFFLFYFQESR